MIRRTSQLSHRHWSLKEKAIKLRKHGLSYNEILQKVPVAKSTISLWCRYVKLAPAQIKKLESGRITKNALKGIIAIQNMFWRRRCESFLSGVNMLKSKSLANKNSRFIAGLMLYWAEGNKKSKAAIANSDPRIIRFTVSWLKEFWDVSPAQIKVHLHIHSGQNENQMISYWSSLTNIPLENFGKSFVKPEGSGYRKNILYNGTVKIEVKKMGSTYLLFKILGAINGFLNQTIEEKIRPEDWMSKLPYADGVASLTVKHTPLKRRDSGFKSQAAHKILDNQYQQKR